MKSNNRGGSNVSASTPCNEILEYIEFDNLSDEELKKIKGLDLLTCKSKNKLISICSKIKVPNKIDHYHPLITEHQNEIEYRKARDKEHKFHDIMGFMSNNAKVKFRNNKPVLCIDVSDHQIKRSYRIVDTFLKVIKDLSGRFAIQYGNDDNLYIDIFGDRFSFIMTEKKVKNRRVSQGSGKGKTMKQFRPVYESMYSGELEMKIEEVTSYSESSNNSKKVIVADRPNNPIENCFEEIFISMLKIANERKKYNVILLRENNRILEEKERLNRIEEENKRAAEEIEIINSVKQNLLDNIEHQMEKWFKSKKLIKYAEELEMVASKMSDETEQELLIQYIKQVRQKADRIELVKDVLKDMKVIGVNGFEE